MASRIRVVPFGPGDGTAYRLRDVAGDHRLSQFDAELYVARYNRALLRRMR